MDDTLDIRSSYRVGSRRLRALPLDTIRQQYLPGWSFISSGIETILCEEKVHVIFYDIVRRKRKFEKIEEVPRSILVVSDAGLEGQYTAWKASVKRIRTLLLHHNFDIAVEIIDTAATGPKLEVITDADTNIMQTWHMVQLELLEEIKCMKWLAVDVLWYCSGRNGETRRPTVVISAMDADYDEWDCLIPRLEVLLGRDLGVDLRCLQSLATTSEEQENAPVAIDSYDKCIAMGSSIGVAGDNGSGTVGMRMKLESSSGEALGLFGLTNHHVIARRPTDVALEPCHELARKQALRVESPSWEDHATTRKWHARMAVSFEASREMHEERGQEYRAQKLLEKARQDNDFLDSDPNRTLGAVYAASGYRSVENTAFTKEEAKNWSKVPSLAEATNGETLLWGLNWALIRIEPPRTMSCLIPEIAFRLKISPGSRADVYRKIKPNRSYKVTKIGRTSRWTTGTINTIASFLNLRKDDSLVVPIQLKDRFAKPILAYGIKSDHDLTEFLEGGDSGSAVLLNDAGQHATIVGLGFASNYATMVSYMTPIDLVIKDIEQITGAKVIEPAEAEPAEGGSPS